MKAIKGFQRLPLKNILGILKVSCPSCGMQVGVYTSREDKPREYIPREGTLKDAQKYDTLKEDKSRQHTKTRYLTRQR